MPGWLGAWALGTCGGIGGAAIGAWLWWKHTVQLPLDQFVRITPKRHAELLDLQRRQQEER
jgi:hypothetical protein